MIGSRPYGAMRKGPPIGGQTNDPKRVIEETISGPTPVVDRPMFSKVARQRRARCDETRQARPRMRTVAAPSRRFEEVRKGAARCDPTMQSNRTGLLRRSVSRVRVFAVRV